MHWRLTTVVDDYGRFDANAKVLLSNCFPLLVDKIKPRMIEKWLQEMASLVPGDEQPLIVLYRVKGRLYGAYTTFLDHQRARDSKPKFPGPEEGTPEPPRNPLTLASCGELPRLAALSESVSERRETRDERRETGKSNACHSTPQAAATDVEFLNSLKANPAYAHINLEVERGKMQAWLALPKNKGRKLTQRFILNWLNKIDPPIRGMPAKAAVPPMPGPDDPIGRSLWRQAHGAG